MTSALLSVAQRNVSLRPKGRLITHYSLRRDRRVGDVGGLAVKGYKNSFFLCRHIPADNVYIARIMRSLYFAIGSQPPQDAIARP